jgi:outer membrane protein OmpA-like peptidoglycan-associated protein
VRERAGGAIASEPLPRPAPRPEPPPRDVDEDQPEETVEPEPEPPPKHAVRVRRGALQLFENIHFETAKATIRSDSFPILDAVAATLKKLPQIKLLEVQGHADERGDDDYNMRLTDARSHAVRQYLVAHGVESDRLLANGYGETRPQCREHRPSCWQKNRRVEFIIVVQEGAIPGQE